MILCVPLPELPFLTRSDRCKCQIVARAGMALPPQIEKPPIAERNVARRVHTEPRGAAVDPLRRALELGVIADGGFVDHAVSLAVGPLGAPFFIAKGGHQAQREKDLRQGVSILHFSLGLDAVLMAIFRGSVRGQALVRDGRSPGILADAKDFCARAQLAVGRVVENIGLETARSVNVKAGRGQSLAHARQVANAEFDLCFDRHDICEYKTAGSLWHMEATIRTVKTLHLTVDPMKLSSAAEALDRAAAILRSGGTVAFPTETVYGLGANALDAAAVERIFAAKERPSWDPVIVHISDRAMLEGLVAEVPEQALRLMERFWPGPLTLLLKRTDAVPAVVTAGLPQVGVRMPSHPVALELIRRAGVPVAAPSANRFGHTSPTTAAHVLDDLDGRIDAVLDAGPAAHGVESTVLDPNLSPMVIYRPGAVTAAQIQDTAGPVELYLPQALPDERPPHALPSPGVGIRHYAPRARVVLVEGPLEKLSSNLAEAVAKCRGKRIGIMLPAEVVLPPALSGTSVYPWGRWSSLEELASRLYAGLRELDSKRCNVILCPVPPASGVGAAIRDRLRKAAR